MTTAPFLLVGEAPNAASVDKPRLWLRPDRSGIRHSANRLLEFTGYDMRTYLRTFDRTNLIHELPPKDGRGRSFPMNWARLLAPDLLGQAARKNQCVILLGARLRQVFDWIGEEGPVPKQGVKYLHWYRATMKGSVMRPVVAVVPHPSGINRWWNSEDNRADARRFFQELQEDMSGFGRLIRQARRVVRTA